MFSAFDYLTNRLKISLSSNYPYTAKFRQRTSSRKKSLSAYSYVRDFLQISNDQFALQLPVSAQPVVAVIRASDDLYKHDPRKIYNRKPVGKLYSHVVCIVGYGEGFWLIRDSGVPKHLKNYHLKIAKNHIFGSSHLGIAEEAFISLMFGLKAPSLANALKSGLYSPEFYEFRSKKSRKKLKSRKNRAEINGVKKTKAGDDYEAPGSRKRSFKVKKSRKNMAEIRGARKGALDKWRLVRARGPAMGLLTEDDMGNSEVGHNALGAGRIFAQGAKLVDLSLASGKVFEDEGFNYIKESFATNTLHLIGLMSDGGVHSCLDQLQLLLRGASQRGAKRIRVHVLTDGRYVLDGSSVGFAETLEAELSDLRSKGIDAQVMYVTMDRYENDWEVVKRGWDAQVLGEAPHKFKNAVEAIKTLREVPGANDQYLPPFVIVDESGKPVGPVVDGDAVVTFNFRANRMTMLAQALEYEKFDKFDRVRVPKIRYAGMLQYDGELKLPSHYLVSPPLIERTSGEYLVHNRTFDCSETVKFGHVTFFWNRKRSGYFNSEMEEYVEIPSDSGITFNVQPLMKALEIGEKARDAILSGKFDQVRVNIPSGDMVGEVEATVLACKAVDEAVKMIIDAVEQVGGIFVVTADHGNAEDMVKRNRKGEPILKSHTFQSVPIAIGGPGLAAGVRFCKDVPSGEPDDYETTLIE